MLSQSAGDLVSTAQRRLVLGVERQFWAQLSRTADRGVAFSTRWEAWGWQRACSPVSFNGRLIWQGQGKDRGPVPLGHD